MQNFHDHKLWQDAFVALMDIHDVTDSIESTGANKEIIEGLLEAAQNVAAKIADGISRTDHRISRQLIWDSVGLVAITRTQLAVCWGRGLVNDEVFKSLDDKYAGLTVALQNFK
jgi:four helix bundle protein